MMKISVKRKLLLSIFVLFASLISAVTCLFAKNLKVSANGESLFQMENKITVRTDGNGLGFKVKMSGDVKDSIDYVDSNLYFIIMPETYLNIVGEDYSKAVTRKEDGTVDADASHCLYVRVNENIYTGEDGYYYANGGVANVNENNRLLPFVAIACIETKNADGTFSYRYADLPNGATEMPVTTQQKALSSAILFNETDYYTDVVREYSWFGSEDYPIIVENQTNYENLVAKVNNGTTFENFKIVFGENVCINLADLKGLEAAVVYPESTDGTSHTVGFNTAEESARFVSQSTEWLAEYNGAKGVVKTRAQNTYDESYSLDLGITKEKLEEDDWKSVDLKVLVTENTGTTAEFCYFYNDGTWDQFSRLATLEPNVWTTVSLTRAQLEKWNALDSFYEKICGTGRMFAFKNAGGDFYVDCVDITYYRNSTDGTSHTLSFDSEKEITKVSNNKTQEWLTEFNGAKGVVKLSSTGNTWDGFKFNVMNSSDFNKYDYGYVVVKLFVEATAYNGHDGQFQLMSPGYGSWFDANKWVEVKIPVKNYNVDTAFSASSRLFGTTNVTAEFVYVDYVDVLPANTFASENEVANVKSGDNAATFLNEFEGATGVAKVTYGGTFDGLFVKIDNPSGLTVSDWTAIEVRIYFENQNGETKGTGTLYNGNVKVADGLKEGWNTLTLTKEALTATDTWYAGNAENLWNTLTSSGERLFWCYDRSGYTMYVDYVKIVK